MRVAVMLLRGVPPLQRRRLQRRLRRGAYRVPRRAARSRAAARWVVFDIARRVQPSSVLVIVCSRTRSIQQLPPETLCLGLAARSATARASGAFRCVCSVATVPPAARPLRLCACSSRGRWTPDAARPRQHAVCSRRKLLRKGARRRDIPLWSSRCLSSHQVRSVATAAASSAVAPCALRCCGCRSVPRNRRSCGPAAGTALVASVEGALRSAHRAGGERTAPRTICIRVQPSSAAAAVPFGADATARLPSPCLPAVQAGRSGCLGAHSLMVVAGCVATAGSALPPPLQHSAV